MQTLLYVMFTIDVATFYNQFLQVLLSAENPVEVDSGEISAKQSSSETQLLKWATKRPKFCKWDISRDM